MGPFVSDFSKDRRVMLAVNAFLAGTAAVLTFLLPETRQMPFPESAEDVTHRRKAQYVNMVVFIFLEESHYKPKKPNLIDQS